MPVQVTSRLTCEKGDIIRRIHSRLSFAGHNRDVHNVAADRHLDPRRRRVAVAHCYTDSGDFQSLKSQYQSQDRTAYRSQGAADERAHSRDTGTISYSLSSLLHSVFDCYFYID